MSSSVSLSCRRFFHAITPPAPARAEGTALVFQGKTPAAWKKWRRSFERQFRAALCWNQRPVAPRPKRIAREILPECVREKWVYDVENDLSVAAWVCRPRESGRRSHPVVLCLHGSGPGKDPLVGLWRSEPCLEYHKRVGVRLAEAGFVTLIPERRGYGECSGLPSRYPQPKDIEQLDEFYRRTRGTSLLALDIWDAVRGVEFLRHLPDVDTARIGCLGVEGGGAVAAGAAALCPTLRATYLSLFLSDEHRVVGPAQLPALEGRAGPIEICGLICPRPLGVQVLRDNCPVSLDSARRAARRVATMYRLAGVPENLSVQYLEGFYELDFSTAKLWFERNLAGEREVLS